MRKFIHTSQNQYAVSKFIPIIVVVILCGVIGTVLLVSSRAATPTVAIEAENGSVSGGTAGVVTDLSASGGKAVKFGNSSAGVPAQCANGGNYLWSNLEACGWPGPANTGYVASQCPGGALTNSTLSKDSQGIVHVATANATISCQKITGCVEVQATGVTIKNNLIQACDGFNIRSTANGTGVVMIDDGASATVTQNELDGQKQVHACVWYQGTTLSATSNNCHGVDDGMFSWADTSYSQTTGNNFTIEDNYFHDFTAATSNGHIDGYQTEGANNGLIQHNTYLMTSDYGTNNSDSAIAIWDSLRSSSGITVNDNLISGGGFSIYAEDYNPSESSPSGGYSVTDIHFTNNKFSTHLFGCVGQFGIWYTRGAPTDQWNRSGNVVLETGEDVDTTNPHSGGTLCS